MTFRRPALLIVPAVLLAATVAGCTSSGGDTSASAPAPIATATQTVTSAAPPTGSGVPASSPAAGGGASASSSSSGPGLCTPTVMTFALGPDNGAAGTSYFSVIATNASQQPCVTTGFPGVALLDGSGGQSAEAQRDTSQGSGQTIVVQPGQKVQATIAAQDIGTGQNQACPSSPKFLFTLPDNTDPTTLTHATPNCTGSNGANALRVQPFVRYTGN